MIISVAYLISSYSKHTFSFLDLNEPQNLHGSTNGAVTNGISNFQEVPALNSCTLNHKIIDLFHLEKAFKVHQAQPLLNCQAWYLATSLSTSLCII